MEGNDIKAGLAVGCNSVLLNGFGSAYADGDYGQDETVASLDEFVEKMGLHYMIAKIGATGIVTIGSYVMKKRALE